MDSKPTNSNTTKKRRLRRNQLSEFAHIFRAVNALWIAIVGAILLTVISILAHLNRDWSLENNFHIVYSFSANFLLLFIILSINFRIIKSTLTLRWKYIIGITSSILIAVIFSALAGWIHRTLYDNIRLSDPDSINLTRDIIVAFVAVLISIVLFSLTRRQQISIEKEQLQTENLLVRYETLENQLDPHFLFNSLNTLSALIGNDDEKAQQYLQQLASTYRYIMQGKRLTDLDDELSFVNSYCQMMQIRFGENLIIEKNIDPRYLHYQIISLSLQLLIENALKHNVVSDRHPLTISLSTTSNHSFLVSNAINPKQVAAPTSGLGLANLSKRYQLLCHKQVNIYNDNNTFSVEVPLLDPLESAIILSQISPNK